jgi:protein SCO1/2
VSGLRPLRLHSTADDRIPQRIRWGARRHRAWSCAVAVLANFAHSLMSPTFAQAPPQDTTGGRVVLAQPARPLADFSLTDQDVRPFQFSALEGRTVLVFFGFTHCQSVCPPTLQVLRQVYRSLDDDGSALTCVFISVDGARDSPAVLKEYLAPFAPGFVGLTGDPTLVRDIAAGFPAVFFKGMPTDKAGGYDVEHSSQVYLVDGERRLRATFYNASAEEMVAVTRTVMQERE